MKDLNLKGCKFCADIVPYMYGELAAADTVAFESHLLECGECTDEFAAISNARYEVYDWKKMDFDPLPTPVFVLPSAEVELAPSWIDRIRAAFAQPWAVPGAAFAALAIVSVFAATVYFSRSGETSLARGDSSASSVEVAPEAASNNPALSNQTMNVAVDEVEEPEEPSPQIARATPDRTTSPKRVTKKIESVRAHETRAVAVRDAGTPRSTNTRAPRLNEFNDDEDTSLRLAMLFDDLDTRND